MSVLTLITQVIVILVTARSIGLLFRKIRQPQVVGEMVAGILLGPSVLGCVAPGIFSLMFPEGSIGYLGALSQLGLLVFMFLIGLQLDTHVLRRHASAAILTSHASIVVPFLFGSALSLYLYPRLSDDRVTFLGFALFMGAAMSVTALPVLARILSERGLTSTKLGSITLACAAADDVTAWCILAGIVVLVRESQTALPVWITIAGSALYSGVMLFAVRPSLQKFLGKRYHSDNTLALVLVLVLASASVTEWLGIHLLFGALLMGVIMPKDQKFVGFLLHKLEAFTVVLLLPLFFAFSGLRTKIGLLDSGIMWFYCLLILIVAVAGKFTGTLASSRISGMPWREASALSILMNTRGLMGLVIVNIGLDIGVISPALFSMMVVMALVTTFMTSPLLDLVYPASRIRDPKSNVNRAVA